MVLSHTVKASSVHTEVLFVAIHLFYSASTKLTSLFDVIILFVVQNSTYYSPLALSPQTTQLLGIFGLHFRPMIDFFLIKLLFTG